MRSGKPLDSLNNPRQGMIISASCLPCGERACAAEAKPLLCFAQVSALISSQLLFGPRGMNRVSARHGRTPREMTKRQVDELVGILVTHPFHRSPSKCYATASRTEI